MVKKMLTIFFRYLMIWMLPSRIWFKISKIFSTTRRKKFWFIYHVYLIRL